MAAPKSRPHLDKNTHRRRIDRSIDLLWRGLLWLTLRLPLRWRVPLMGAIFARLVSPLTGRRKIALKNLALIYPDRTPRERARIATAAADNIGRTMIENYGIDDLKARSGKWQSHGPGVTPMQEAHKAGRPILFISGHFGNYAAPRLLYNLHGYNVTALYRPLKNPYLNAHYVDTISGMGGGAFTRDRRGLAGFVKHLRAGHQGAILIDQYVYDGVPVDFLGRPALTSTAAAEIALKCDALLMPVYSTRLPNGLDFRIDFEAPIPHTDPLTMTQALNASISARIHATPEQWLWVHDRWKPERHHDSDHAPDQSR